MQLCLYFSRSQRKSFFFGSNTKLGVLFDEVISRQFSDPHHDKGADYHDPWYRNQVPTRSEFFRPDAFGGRMLGCDSVGGVGWPKRCDMFQFWCIMIFEFLKVLVNFRGRAGGTR